MTAERITDYQLLMREVENSTRPCKMRIFPVNAGGAAGIFGQQQEPGFFVNPATSAARLGEMSGSLSGSRYYATMGRSRATHSHLKENWREIAQIEKSLDLLEFETVEEPGVIPRTLAVTEEILKHVHAVEPKIDTTVDSVNTCLVDSKKVLGGVDTALNGVVNIALEYHTFVRIGLIAATAGFVATMLLLPLLVIRAIFFGLA